MKLSFSISSSNKPSSRPNPTKTPQTLGQPDTGPDAGATKPEYVTVFDPSQTLTPGDTKPAIPPLPNTDTWRATKRMKNLLPPPDPASTPSDPASRFVLDSSNADAAASNISYGLTVRSNPGEASGGEGDRGGRPASEPIVVSADQKFRQDIENLPDDRGFDEFADISVEDFSAAVLAGYGWKEGQGIGRNAKADTKVVEFKRWAGTGGLGYAPDMPSSDRKRRGKVHEEKPPASPAESNGVKKKVVRVVSGRHAGLKGEILETSRRSNSSPETYVLSLLRSGEEVRIGSDMVAELGSEEEEKCLKKLKELEVRGKDERREERTKDKWHRDGDGRGDREAKHDSGTNRRSSSDKDRVPVSWLRSHIRVRVISKDFKGGKLYLKKGKVMDVVGPGVCDLLMEDTGELLQGVDQDILETALPKHRGRVLVLYGRHKDVFGNLMEKDMGKETAVVQDAHNLEFIKVRLEQIAEYVGDPSYIGY